jgi:hypothetical protein
MTPSQSVERSIHNIAFAAPAMLASPCEIEKHHRQLPRT